MGCTRQISLKIRRLSADYRVSSHASAEKNIYNQESISTWVILAYKTRVLGNGNSHLASPNLRFNASPHAYQSIWAPLLADHNLDRPVAAIGCRLLLDNRAINSWLEAPNPPELNAKHEQCEVLVMMA